jgi:hypothetical protein
MKCIFDCVHSIKKYLFALLPLGLALAPHHVHAQDFQQPTPEELSMTADPKAPGSAAVYLYYENIVDDDSKFDSYYIRIKILTEKGKELATVKAPYHIGQYKIDDIKGRTIHPDGTVIPLNVKPEDLVEFKTKGYQYNSKVFTLPSVEVGSIIEYRYKMRYENGTVVEPRWDVQHAYFTRKAHYTYITDNALGHYVTNIHGQRAPYLLFASLLGPGFAVQHHGSQYNLDITDIPALPDEDWAPPLGIFNWHVYFYYTTTESGPEFWKKEGELWQSGIENFCKVTKKLREAANSIVSPGDSDELKAHKIYDALMKFENTDYTRTKSAAEKKAEKIKNVESIEDIWKQKSGNSNDIALLYYSLALASGLKVYPMQVVNRDRALFDYNYLTITQLDEFIVIVNLNGKEVFIDPGERFCAFGELHWNHYIAGGMRLNQDGKSTSLAMTPSNPYTSAVTQRVADIALAEDGSITGIARFKMNGPEALYWRHQTLTSDNDEIKKLFNEELLSELPDGVQAEFDQFQNLDKYNEMLIAVVKLSGNLGNTTGKRYFLPGLFFESKAKHPFTSQPTRFAPVDMHYAKLIQDAVAYHIPSAYSVESAPDKTALDWPNHSLLRIQTKIDGSTVTINRSFATNFIGLPNKEYNDLHDFYLKLSSADQQQLVLTRTPANPPKGN